MTFKPTQIVAAAALLVAGTAAFAQAKAPEPDYTLSYNIVVLAIKKNF